MFSHPGRDQKGLLFRKTLGDRRPQRGPVLLGCLGQRVSASDNRDAHQTGSLFFPRRSHYAIADDSSRRALPSRCSRIMRRNSCKTRSAPTTLFAAQHASLEFADSSERAPSESSGRNFRSRSTVVSTPAIRGLSESKPFGLIRRRPLRHC